MGRKINLIWDFKGLDALETAKHHCIHLKEFAERDNLMYYDISYDRIQELHYVAFITIAEDDLKIFRDTLKPHRGTVADGSRVK